VSDAEQDSANPAAVEPDVAPAGAPALFSRLHPLGWVAVAFAVLAVIATVLGWDMLVARMPWWLWALTIATIAISAVPQALHRLRLGIEAVSEFTGGIAMALAWVIFFLQLFNVITRYTNSWFEADILFGETTSLAWMSFGMLFLLGVAYGAKNGINPRIDFWWAEFSKRRKAWLDFSLHTLLFLPFLILGLRVLKPYAARSLGYNRFANGGEGSWPAGWRVWESWEKSGDAGQLAVGPIQAFIFVAFMLWIAQVVAEIIKTGFVIAGRDDLGDISDTDETPLRIE
jgi:TRAP-type mannitol/chloroaromatic compound transport system permease small subunit